MKNPTKLNGIQLIAAERIRQIEDEKFTASHDDSYTGPHLARAAESYISTVTSSDAWSKQRGLPQQPNHDWPFAKRWWKPSKNKIRNLVKAGALIAAEIDRLQRLES